MSLLRRRSPDQRCCRRHCKERGGRATATSAEIGAVVTIGVNIEAEKDDTAAKSTGLSPPEPRRHTPCDFRHTSTPCRRRRDPTWHSRILGTTVQLPLLINGPQD